MQHQCGLGGSQRFEKADGQTQTEREKREDGRMGEWKDEAEGGKKMMKNRRIEESKCRSVEVRSTYSSIEDHLSPHSDPTRDSSKLSPPAKFPGGAEPLEHTSHNCQGAQGSLPGL